MRSGSINRLVRPVYIGAVVNARETSFVAAQKAVFRDQKKLFFLKVFASCKEGRGQTMWGSGQYMVRNDQTQRASVYMM